MAQASHLQQKHERRRTVGQTAGSRKGPKCGEICENSDQMGAGQPLLNEKYLTFLVHNCYFKNILSYVFINHKKTEKAQRVFFRRLYRNSTIYSL